MSANILLNLFNELRKNKIRSFAEHLVVFAQRVTFWERGAHSVDHFFTWCSLYLYFC